MIEAKPIKDNDVYYEQIKKRIMDVYRKYFFIPLIKELNLPESTIKNTKTSNLGLIESIKKGRISFWQGKFSGPLNAQISKELRAMGAKWDKRTSQFTMQLTELPEEVKRAIEVSEHRFNKTLLAIDKKITGIKLDEFVAKIKIADIFDKQLWKTQGELESSLKKITIIPKLNEFEADYISREWQDNMRLWVKNFTEEQIVELRKTVLHNVFKGNRREELAKLIKKTYGVTDNKANFLARQETRLLLEKYKEARYTKGGSKHYRWKTVTGSPAHPVRPDHKRLDGKVFKWDDPPVTNLKTGARNSPGTDYNCRCFPIPLFNYEGPIG